MKDVGGYVNEYQSHTELYRATDREVRLHECRSACTLALSLPNVCVYPDSTLKFHMAYDPRNHQSNYDVSQQLFNSYPPAVRERLGSLTRDYKVLRGAELIALGVRDCSAPRGSETMVASNAAREAAAAPALADSSAPQQGSLLGGLMRNVASVFGAPGGKSEPRRQRIEQDIEIARMAPGKAPAAADLAAEAPLPPPRPADVTLSKAAADDGATVEAADEPAAQGGAGSPQETQSEITYAYGVARVSLPKVIDGAQQICRRGSSLMQSFSVANRRLGRGAAMGPRVHRARRAPGGMRRLVLRSTTTVRGVRPLDVTICSAFARRGALEHFGPHFGDWQVHQSRGDLDLLQHLIGQALGREDRLFQRRRIVPYSA